SGNLAGRPCPSTPILSSAAADLKASSATTASSPACAHDARRRYDAAIPASAPSSRPATELVASQPARSGPVGSDSAIRPATSVSGTSRVLPCSMASSSSANSASAGSALAGSASSSASAAAEEEEEEEEEAPASGADAVAVAGAAGAGRFQGAG